ncbi:uncharacterized protein M421DRAFT_401486 [Didymella exigua CBS 183.55]|uniref:Uncharacterized protein n=1 Tax=Didymella exigua CBS 183.55 TaxID=1150837 RepID=A0A6A5RCN7_9PLEO|nr:uncharacterized protein M421DRAFT_401486 [Didymella exigua CBS 183.55]KAF1924844.1 hypothetical protein M421DRAFT_401486 [Didymella exigua CBS 183.55]
MGNCGSSLNCAQCFYPEPRRNCTTEIEVNADIAGIGVLTSLYFSAWILSIVIVWGYFRKSLPSDLLTSTDHYIVQLLKRRLSPFSDVDVKSEQTAVQRKTSGVVTGFTKILGDQQLISGIAILSAGLASRCNISLYEFNIVTCLAYFCLWTHLVSLQVLRGYLYTHTFVRAWRIGLTIGLFLLFGFSYTINTATYDVDFGESSRLNIGNMFQCVFEAPEYMKSVRFDAWYSVTLVGTLAYRHVLAIGDLFFPPETDTINVLISRITSRFLRKTGLSQAERREIVENSFAKYYDWLRPPKEGDNRTPISKWYYLQIYFDSYLSSIPALFAGMSYGTVSTIQAVWGDFDTTGLEKLGFGQIVALGLLLLTLLAAAEIRNEQSIIASVTNNPDPMELSETPVQDEIDNTTSGETSIARDVAINASDPCKERYLCFGVTKPKSELHRLTAMVSTPDDFDDSPIIARRLAMVLGRIWVAHTLLYTYVGLGWNFSMLELSIVTLMVLWKSFRVLLVFKRIHDQTYFVKIEAEVRIRKNSRLSSSSRQPLVCASSTQPRASVASTQPSMGHSTSVSGPPSPSIHPYGATGRSGSSSSSHRRNENGSDAESPIHGSLQYRGLFPFTPA